MILWLWNATLFTIKGQNFFELLTCSSLNTCLMKKYWRLSLAKLMQSCSKLFSTKSSKPKMSNMEMVFLFSCLAACFLFTPVEVSPPIILLTLFKWQWMSPANKVSISLKAHLVTSHVNKVEYKDFAMASLASKAWSIFKFIWTGSSILLFLLSGNKVFVVKAFLIPFTLSYEI